MDHEILDDELAQPRGNSGAFYVQLFTAILFATVFYTPFYILVVDGIQYESIYKTTIVKDSISVLHQLLGMLFFHFSYARNREDKSRKGGFYFLLFVSGFFFLGASFELASNILLRDQVAYEQGFSFWSQNYEHLITLFVIFIKFIIIIPLVKGFSYLERYV